MPRSTLYETAVYTPRRHVRTMFDGIALGVLCQMVVHTVPVQCIRSGAEANGKYTKVVHALRAHSILACLTMAPTRLPIHHAWAVCTTTDDRPEESHKHVHIDLDMV